MVINKHPGTIFKLDSNFTNSRAKNFGNQFSSKQCGGLLRLKFEVWSGADIRYLKLCGELSIQHFIHRCNHGNGPGRLSHFP